jgi:hypothetical protein
MTNITKILLAAAATAPLWTAPAFAWDAKDTDTSLNGQPQTLMLGDRAVTIGVPYQQPQSAMPGAATAQPNAGGNPNVEH